MKIAIHHRKNSFSVKWIEYCNKNNIKYSIVNCRDNDILEKLKSFDGLMWHWGPDEAHYAVPLTISLEKLGIKVFPDFNTCWHFDNKIAEKYILDTCNIKQVPTYIFYDKKSALNWINNSTFPKVFKLRNGASSTNVKLVKTKKQAKRIVKKAFSSGFHSNDRLSILKNQIWKFKRDKTFRRFLGIINGLRILLMGSNSENILAKEKGYVYFQEFLPNNDFDTRVQVIGNRAFFVRRFNRTGDFKASGSGKLKFDPNIIDVNLLKMSFALAAELKTNSLASDYLYNDKEEPNIVEISYGFPISNFYENCQGYWTPDLKWHDEKVQPEIFIIEDFINSLMKDN
jgi:glutathione synthase/RimK-type ligase-like ATP-grasp enzyme